MGATRLTNEGLRVFKTGEVRVIELTRGGALTHPAAGGVIESAPTTADRDGPPSSRADPER